MVKIRPDEISSIIRQQIEQYNQEVKVLNVGTVLQVGDGMCGISSECYSRLIQLSF